MNDIECPYCEAENTVNHDDGAGYAEDEMHEMECVACDKLFTFQTVMSFDYYPSKADCLNGGEHIMSEWRRRWTHEEGGESQVRSCEACDYSESRFVKLGEEA